MNNIEKEFCFSFRSGWYQIPDPKRAKFRQLIMERLGIAYSTFNHKLAGLIEPRISEVYIIEKTFAEFNVIENIWGDA